MKYVNSNLISLKCVIFLFFGGLGCLIPFLPLHMTAKGLSLDESKLISIVAPCLAILGPAIAGPLADKLAGGSGGGSQRSKTGRYLRVMLSVCFILAAILYWLLMLVPVIMRSPPNVVFTCDQRSGVVLQERCGADKTCYEWNSDKRGDLYVSNCRFTCDSSLDWSFDATTIYPDQDTSAGSEEYDDNDYNDNDIIVQDDETVAASQADEVVPHPHLCYTDVNGLVVCEVFTKYSKPINLNVNLFPSSTGNSDDEEDTICTYNIGSNFHCRIPAEIERNLTRASNSCHPVIKCNIHEPYRSSNMLKVSECGYDNISFWLYLFIRSVADIFPAAAVALLDAAVIIATRETSTGRGDVGKQLACGALGFAIFSPLIGGLDNPLVSLITFSTLMVLATLVLLIDWKMPLSPPEWWWHTRCGLLALPMSSVRKYTMETAGLALVLVLLGTFWSAMDSYLPWRISDLSGTPLLIGLAVTAGALPAIPFLIYAEKIVDYCGHSNILISCFTFYIFHYIGLSLITDPGLLLFCEALEVFTLHLMWITAVLYLRHLVPRRFTVCGQALPVIAHFCIGRFLGALIGGLAYSGDPEQFTNVHKWFAIVAAIIASVYFLTYHFYMKPSCAAPVSLPPRPIPAPTITNGASNGSYTPLRVYHNGRAKKGQFRY